MEKVEVAPRQLFRKTKLALLLSLLSVPDSQQNEGVVGHRNAAHVLVVSSDPPQTARLLRFASEYARLLLLSSPFRFLVCWTNSIVWSFLEGNNVSILDTRISRNP